MESNNHEIKEEKEIRKVGNIKSGKKKKMPIWLVILIVVIVLFIVIMLFGNKKIEPLYDDSGNPVYVESDKLDYVYSDTENYLGKFVELSGQIFNEPETDSDTTILQIWADPENSQKNTIIYYNGKLDVKTNDYVKLTGYVYELMTYKNAFGGKMSAPAIVATKIEKSNHKDVVTPTTKEVNYTDKVINQYNYKIEVTKVEFSEKETRVYVTATNDTKDEFSIYNYSAVITQNGKQYEQSYDFNIDYDELQSTLKAGITDTGVLVFPKIEQDDFKLLIDGSSSNWDIDIDEYEFSLEVE